MVNYNSGLNGVTVTNAPTVGQVLEALSATTASWQTGGGGPPTGAAGGDLGSTYPNPTVTATHLSAALPLAQGGTGAAAQNFTGLLTPAAVKTGAYNAAAGDFVPVDTTSGAVTVTLPTAPADLTVIGIKMVTQGGTNAVTYACGGSDVLNKSGGATSGTLALLAQGVILQYKASEAIWYVYADDLPLAQLDLRYLKLAGGTMTGPIAMGTSKITGLGNGSAASDAAALGQVVNSISAADTSVVVAGGGTTTPTVRTATLDVIAAQHPAAADWSNNSHKITSLANGSAVTDAAALGQVVNSISAADTSVVVAGGSTTTPTVATGTLDVIAAQHPPAGNWSNNSHKITSLANGSAAQDAAAFGQVHAVQATTGTSGYALVNGTGTILTWTTPNDGLLHRVSVYGTLFATTTETGGQISANYTDPGGNANSTTVWGTGLNGASAGTAKDIVCKANTAVTLSQSTALTAGGPTTLWAELWGS